MTTNHTLVTDEFISMIITVLKPTLGNIYMLLRKNDVIYVGCYQSIYTVTNIYTLLFRRGYTIGDAGDASLPTGVTKKICDP
jgi:hypothetical protein